METFTWLGIGLCLANSGVFSGLNLALLGVSRLRLEAEAEGGNPDAVRILELRKDFHFLLTTLLWGNVAVNCLLTLLSESVLAGVGGFLFATFGITFFGEIGPQAFFSRHAISVGARLAPLVRFYQVLFYPVAKPTAMLLDRMLGKEGIVFFGESDFRQVIQLHVDAEESDLGLAEGTGALNFLTLDDLAIGGEGQPINPQSVISVPDGSLPPLTRRPEDAWLQRIQASGEKWVVLEDVAGVPQWVIDADGLLRTALLEMGEFDPARFCHRPIVVEDARARLGPLLRKFEVEPESEEDDVIDRDVMLLWGTERRILTGADILGRLLRGIATRVGSNAPLRAAEATE